MSITGLGSSYKQQALSGLRNVAGMESRREMANDQIKAQDKQSKIATSTTGAGIGFMAGMSSTGMGAQFGSWAGPVGAVAGLAGGYLISSLF